ncbi:putative bifunctional diguanylate cyclase/phosphodiesterase [Halomonas sp. GD1P12]|uniref:putative bifunctional diguanylate cyclase/phosphodiesterase n=1 Tax=Halomonas sp. GD1P12 TaxID=2982691 RepID=UPI0021E3852F|nr:bifunctional diguanylate cyclase/phosphodiesterase [Halomonas sp. GD1P12]UYF99916.1 EAL domain-containing protein [Halomonas sp. GD1P12]
MHDHHTSYNLALVLLSFGVASIASFTALDLAGRVRASRGVVRHLWLAGGAFAMGTGIWAMHFIGMLAMEMGARVDYGIFLTLLSLVAAIASSALALFIVQSGRVSLSRLSIGALIMGGGVCLMHYVGMAAMHIEGSMRYAPALFLTSVAIAVSASGVALWLAFRLNPTGTRRAPLWQRLIAALVMAVGISGMHYTGMAAAVYPQGFVPSANVGISTGQLAISVALVSTCIMLAALMISLFDAHMSSRNAQLAASLQEANAELKQMIYRDALTQLPNRLLLEERLEEQLGQQVPFALFFVDLDRFKQVNDTLGHHVGDQLIRQAAIRLRTMIREADTVARVGGDEFIVLLGEHSTREDAAELAKRLVSTLANPFQIGASLVKVSTSIGISLHPEDGSDKHSLMIHADAAMYAAKRMGRNNFQFFELDMTSHEKRRAALERRLRLAIDNDGLRLAYQPRVDVDNGRITGVEALLRWEDEELGTVEPSEIIPVAEDTGLILPIGEWVLRTACTYAFDWQEEMAQPLFVSVNISAIQLNNRHFIDMVKKVLEETGLEPSHLELELTESALVLNPEVALTILVELRGMGVTLSVDDFGTGYSNLALLRRLPIDRLKIDRSFMSHVVTDVQDAAIVKAVIALAQSLNLQVVAEGVESEQQLSLIRQLHTHEYQGFLFSEALEGEELKRFWGRHASMIDRTNNEN